MRIPPTRIYFDAQSTLRRFDAVKQAAEAGKHVYCEKPTAITTENAYALYKICRDAGVKNGWSRTSSGSRASSSSCA